MKKPRTLEIVSLMWWAGSTFLHNDKLTFTQGSSKLKALGGLYIKFLQLVVLNLDPDNERNYQAMLEVYEHSPPDRINLWQYLQRELAPSKLQEFTHLDREPFATGSFGQVYHGQLRSGERVVVKVLRPSVQKYLKYDLRLLSLVSRLYGLLDRQTIINYRSVFKQFKQTSLQEVDYRGEAAVANYYYQTYKDHPHLVIPKTFIELSTSKVLVQEYVHGVSLTQMLALQTKGEDSQRYVREVLNSNLFTQLEVVGTELLGQGALGNVMHADPHPGNIILLANNRVALIDFGMSTVLHENRYAFYQMLVQYVGFYSGKLAIEELAISAFRFLQRDLFEAVAQADTLLGGDSDETRETIINKIRFAVSETFYDESNQAVVAQLLARRMIARVLFFTINKGNRFGFSFDLEAINIIKAAQNFAVLMGKFDKEGQVIARVLQNVVNRAEANFDRLVDSKEMNARPDPHTAIEILSCWVDKMGRNDPQLMRQLTSGHLK